LVPRHAAARFHISRCSIVSLVGWDRADEPRWNADPGVARPAEPFCSLVCRVGSGAKDAHHFQCVPVPPCFGLSLGPKGTVIPGRLLPTQFLPAAPPLSPIGNPDGDASFMLWQPGLAQLTSSTDPSGTYRIHSWSTSFAAWSPDGRYLINDLNFWGLLTSTKVIYV